MDYIICLALFIPLIGFLLLSASSDRISRNLASFIGCLTIFISFASFVYLLAMYAQGHINEETVLLFHWITLPEINANFTLHLDHLSLLMCLIITGVGFLIHAYSIGYVDHEKDFARYFACMNFFIFSMLLLVLAADLALLFVGWEGVGLASYLLIGFWYTRPAAAAAATKAFVINRIGDYGFLLGLLLTFYLFGTSNIKEISSNALQQYSNGSTILTVLTLLYVVGAIGKSAQLPLYTWLPDAMEGPTPVSALIHAATMVTAGVYLIVRLHPLFLLTPFTLQVVGIIGGVTSLFAALCALGQVDLKRVLAYSTVSQLGLMFLACGAGAFYSAMFHLTTHAFVKALLFLSAGNVVHMLGTTDMREMGGLSKVFTKTHWYFLIGTLALSGIPPLATFFSKDLILEYEYASGFDALFYIALAASILTGFYLMRAYCLTFAGTQEVPRLTEVKEAPAVMLLPIAILAFLSVVGGFLGFSLGHIPILEEFLVDVGVTHEEEILSTSLQFSPEFLLAIIGSIFGVGLSAVIYSQFREKIGQTWLVLKKAFYVDEIYDTLIVYPLDRLAHFIAYFTEPKIFDSSINMTVNTVQKTASILQEVQSGQIRSYVAWMILGMVFLVAYIVL